MNFEFTQEQVMLRDSVARFIQDDYSFDERQRIAQSDTAMSADHWNTLRNWAGSRYPLPRSTAVLAAVPWT